MRRLWLVALALAAGCPTKSNPLFCQTNNDCRDPAKLYCDVVRGECIPTPANVDLAMSTTDGGADLAVPACVVSPDCPASMPVCEGQMCRTCAGPADDTQCLARSATTPRCANGQCVACRPDTQQTDCTGTTPICGANNVCRKCESHSECGADGICVFDGADAGKCVPATDIAYVNIGNNTCNDALHASTPSAPYCQIQAAATVSGKKYIRVAGNLNSTYNGVSLTSGLATPVDLVIVGPGLNVNPPAQIAQQNTVGLMLSAPSGSLNVTIDGLTVAGLGPTLSPEGITCTGVTGTTATLTLRRSIVQGTGAAGLKVDNCSLLVTESTFTKSTVGATLNVPAARTYAITNSFFVANSERGIQMTGNGNGLFAFNTVAGNAPSVTNAAGGIDCGGNAYRIIEGSIVALNGREGIGGGRFSQIINRCILINTVAYLTGVTDEVANALPGPVEFVSTTAPTNFRLETTDATKLATNRACCIDKITGTVDGGVTTLPTRDVDGNARPRGGKWDIGAHEAQ
jgi:hypothetical protein